MGSKIQKTITRLQGTIEEGQYYEAHQQLRTIASRYVKQENYSAAVDILFSGAQSLLKAGQGGSGGDLCLFLVDVYKNAELKPDAGTKEKLLTLLRLFSPDEPSRKRFIADMIAWSSAFGEFPAGDPELHHVVGTLYSEDNNVYDAERHLTLGTKDSPEHLIRLEYDWYSEDDSHTAALYAARAVFPYLLIGNVRDATRSLQLFTSRLRETNGSLSVQEVGSGSVEAKLYPSLPLLNFLSLLLLAVQRGSADLYRQLMNHYATYLQETSSWGESLELVGEMYFGVPVRRQTNPLMDMMGSLFGGAGGPAAPPTKSRKIQAAPPAADLD
ncbi:MAG: hypothetical protein M1838_006060 [Thelocarpon superellum]|nr:MAG: hypothetical protein M1838_006060 [Thelocarpon superellum]